MSELISCIVPVYKVEKYLRRCIESILIQTYKNIELILVDDGSPDCCGGICDEYAKKDSRVKVIHKKNAGVAMARNDGLNQMRGDYVIFADSDDWYEPKAFEVMHNALVKNNADCVIGQAQKVIDRNGTLSIKKEKHPDTVQYTDCEEALKRLLLNGSAAWNRLYKAEIYRDVRFPQGRINDDEAATLQAYANCRKFVWVPDITYNYRIRENSITTSKFSLKNRDIITNSKEYVSFIQKKYPQLVPCAQAQLYKRLLYCYKNVRFVTKDSPLFDWKLDLKKEIKEKRTAILKNEYVPQIFRLYSFTVL